MVIKNIDTKTVVAKFAVNGYNVHPDAVKLILSYGLNVDLVVNETCRRCNGAFIITPEEVSAVIRELEKRKKKADLPVKSIERTERKENIRVLKDIT